jgi:glyoxylate reductase
MPGKTRHQAPASLAPRIFVTRALPAASLERLTRALPEATIDVNREERGLTREEIALRSRGAAALLCTLGDPVDRTLLEALAPELRVVSTYAVGYENIDLEAALALGVRVTHTPGVLTDATAEIAVVLLLACARRVVEGDRLVRAGRWSGWTPRSHRGHAVYGKTVGVVGAGRIGERVAATLRHGFDCRILVHSREPRPEWEASFDARFVRLPELLERSDFVTLHCPLTPRTRHLIDDAALARMKPTACLVNTARGPVVDEAALVRALASGVIAAAGLDVYEEEPRLTPGLADLPNVVLLPHIGSATLEAREAMGRLAVDAVVDVLRGREPAHPLV